MPGIANYRAGWNVQTHQGVIVIFDEDGNALDARTYANPLEFGIVIDLLRNEKPLNFASSATTARIETGEFHEPVGEEEASA